MHKFVRWDEDKGSVHIRVRMRDGVMCLMTYVLWYGNV
jgi:hypothetical protein